MRHTASEFHFFYPQELDRKGLPTLLRLQLVLSRLLKLQRHNHFLLLCPNLAGKPVPVVGSFSVSDRPNCVDRYSSLKEIQENFSAEGVSVLPQWLPPYAWYFGGSVPLNMFNDQEALDIVSSIDLEICLDLCHFQMARAADNFSGDTMKCLGLLLELTRHVHLAMASGPFDEGGDFSVMSDVMRKELLAVISHENSSRMVVEVWQGHLRGYQGFYNALAQLSEIISNG